MPDNYYWSRDINNGLHNYVYFHNRGRYNLFNRRDDYFLDLNSADDIINATRLDYYFPGWRNNYDQRTYRRDDYDFARAEYYDEFYISIDSDDSGYANYS